MMLRVDFDELEPSDDFLLRMYKGKPFTGIAFELWPSGQLRDEVSFVDGMEDGITRSWSESGILLREYIFFMKRAHGFFREWFENGQLKSEQKRELGVSLSYREWSEDGTLIKEETLKDGDPEWEHLQALRRQLGPELKERHMPAVLP